MAFKAFDRVVHIAPGSSDDAFIAAQLAAAARDALREAQGAKEAPPTYVRAVNARLNVPEEQVKTPGAIVYSMDWTREATAFAVAWLRISSPRRSGRYARSFVVMSEGRETAIAAIKLGAGAAIVNTQPYSRKIEIGAKGFVSFRKLFERARAATLREFRGLVSARVKFVDLAGGYHLQRTSKRKRAAKHVTYPALEILSEQVLAS